MAKAKVLKAIISLENYERLHRREKVIIKTPKGEVMELAFSLTVPRPKKRSKVDELLENLDPIGRL